MPHSATWTLLVRGEVYRLNRPRKTVGHEQSGHRFAVVVQAPELDVLSTWLVAPTSTSARAALFRPEVRVLHRPTRVLCEQTTAVDPTRLGEHVGVLGLDEMRRVDDALRLVLDLT